MPVSAGRRVVSDGRVGRHAVLRVPAARQHAEQGYRRAAGSFLHADRRVRDLQLELLQRRIIRQVAVHFAQASAGSPRQLVAPFQRLKIAEFALKAASYGTT